MLPSAVPNPSFEADPVGDYGMGSETLMTGWQQVYGTGTLSVVQPTSADFPIDGSGNLPLPALGKQAIRDSVLVPGDDAVVMTIDPLPLPGQGWRPTDDNSSQTLVSGGLQHGYAYTMTVAIGYSATNGFSWFDGFNLGFNCRNLGNNIMNAEIPSSDNPSIGTFKDFSITFSADWMLGLTGQPWVPIIRKGKIIGYQGRPTG